MRIASRGWAKADTNARGVTVSAETVILVGSQEVQGSDRVMRARAFGPPPAAKPCGRNRVPAHDISAVEGDDRSYEIDERLKCVTRG